MYDGTDRTSTPTVYPSQSNALPTALLLGALGAGLGWLLGDKSYGVVSHLLPGFLSYTDLPLAQCGRMIFTEAWRWVQHQPCQFESWMLWPVLPAIAGGLAAGFFGYKTSIIKPVRQLSGTRLVLPTEIPKAPKREGVGVKAHETFLTLSREEECNGIVLIGKTGGGKTTVMMPLIDQAIARGDAVCIVDFKGDYAKRYHGQAYQILPWSPDEEFGSRWQIGKDIRNSDDAEAFAEGLIPPSDDPLWSTSARSITQGIIQNLQTKLNENWGWQELARDLREFLADTEKLEKAIEEHRPLMASGINKMASDTRESIFANIRAFGDQVLELAAQESKIKTGLTWSVTDWITNTEDRGVVILGWNPKSETKSKRIVLPIIKTVIQHILGLPDRRPNERGFWICADECGNLGEIPNFPTAFTAIRSRGGRPLVGFQSFRQQTELYGDLAEVFITETMFLGKLLSPKDKQDASDIVGDGVFERLHISTAKGNGQTQNWQRAEEPIYRPERFSQLGRWKNGVKFLYVGRGVAAPISFPFLKKLEVKFEKDD